VAKTAATVATQPLSSDDDEKAVIVVELPNTDESQLKRFARFAIISGGIFFLLVVIPLATLAISGFIWWLWKRL
jgi:hypothetical protein